MGITWEIAVVLGLMACGYLARKRGVLSDSGTTEMSRLLIAFIYPALILTSVTRLSATELAANILVPAVALGIILAGLLLGWLALKGLPATDRRQAGSFLFQCVFNNYLFLPLPLVLLLWGAHGVALLVFSSVAFELALWTLGVFLLTSGLSLRKRMVSLLNPPFCALAVSFALVILRDVVWAEGLQSVPAFAQELKRVVFFGAEVMGQGTVAVSMLVAGSRIAALHPRVVMNARIWVVAGLRLVGVPLLVLPLIAMLPLDEAARGVLMVISVMPCAIASVVFGDRFDGDRDFIAGALFLTHLWALVTVPVWLAIWL